MYFLNRLDLGATIGDRLLDLKGQEAVVIAINDKAITSSISLATQINAWIYPLVTEPVYLPGDPRLIGLVNADGVFVWNPNFSTGHRADFEMNSFSALDEAKRKAFSAVNRRHGAYGEIPKSSLNGRILVLMGDIIRDSAELAAAIEFLKDVQFAKLYASGGNVDPQTATFMKIQASHDLQLDILANMFGDDHYFEQQDSYTADESRQILVNISQFWT